jgi:hypothetical protein
MARKHEPKKPGAEFRLNKFKLLHLTDMETGEFIATVRWRRCGRVAIEHAKHVKPKVAPDPKTATE